MDIGYSDGDAERFLLELFQSLSADQLGSMSEELECAAQDWPTEYHLSRQRHCLLRPLRIGPGDRVLEIGAGCGAMTRYLGETGAHVTALEGSLLRAQIAAERCRDLENVEVIAGNFGTFQQESEFDWVIAVGVLEYANLFIGHVGATEQFLEKARRLLSPSGQFVVAIENQFGLKYWAGASEDHVGIPYFGIENRYSTTTATTYGRVHLQSLLHQAGFDQQELLLPYPDYKLPKTIVRAAAIADGDLSVSSLVYGLHGRDYGPKWYSFVDEHRIYGLLQRNELVSDLANSFLVVAGAYEHPREALEPGDVWVYSVGNRRSRFAKEVVISGRVSADCGARARRLDASAESRFEMSRGGGGSQVIESALFMSGETEAVVVHQSFATRSPSTVAGAFQRWAEHVMTLARPTAEGSVSELRSWVLDGVWLDLIPQNMIFAPPADPYVFDLEWRIDGDIPLGWVLFRAVEHCSRFLDPRPVLSELCGLIGLRMADEDFEEAQELERDFQQAVTVPRMYEKALPVDLEQLEFRLRTAESEARRASEELAAVMRRRIVRVGLSVARWLRPIFRFRALGPWAR